MENFDDTNDDIETIDNNIDDKNDNETPILAQEPTQNDEIDEASDEITLEEGTLEKPSTRKKLLIELDQEVRYLLADQLSSKQLPNINPLKLSEDYGSLVYTDPIAMKNESIEQILILNRQMWDLFERMASMRASLKNMDRILGLLHNHYKM